MFHNVDRSSVIPSLANRDLLAQEKRRNLYQSPSYHWRLLALPYLYRTATQKPTPVYATITSDGIFHKTPPNTGYNISTGIYRCSILATSMKFCENFQWTRISADKRLSLYFTHCVSPRLVIEPLRDGLRVQS